MGSRFPLLPNFRDPLQSGLQVRLFLLLQKNSVLFGGFFSVLEKSFFHPNFKVKIRCYLKVFSIFQMHFFSKI
ncbi:hypothetical protein OA84_00920 [Kaistella solincola]|uniref:Uncharacterized protein n=1 Tax=Kaistella solincola TaxID=510955 RepID=A0ABR4ZT64_9FLAO|nr:hypothetical protein OA84_00920 [Kaistella solincola]